VIGVLAEVSLWVPSPSRLGSLLRSQSQVSDARAWPSSLFVRPAGRCASAHQDQLDRRLRSRPAWPPLRADPEMELAPRLAWALHEYRESALRAGLMHDSMILGRAGGPVCSSGRDQTGGQLAPSVQPH